MLKDDWFIEVFEKTASGLTFRVDEVLFSGESPFQRVAVIRNAFFGNVMLLDDLVMLTERDEFYYHDMLVHVPLMCVDEPRDVLIIGGGDGGSVREALKHPSVRRVVLCEIDQMVIDVSRRFFPSLAERLDDERVEICVGDGIRYVHEHPGEFDCVCIDSTDPIGPAVGLFTPEFYTDVKAALRAGGAMSAQTESPAWSLNAVRGIRDNIARAFEHPRLYLAPSPCYPSGSWSFALALKSDRDPACDFDVQRAAQISRHCRYYNPDIHRAAFVLPNFIRDALL